LDYREKLPRYREDGIPEICVVDRFRQEVLRESRTETGYLAETFASGRLSSTVVPGFCIEVAGSGVRSCPRRWSVAEDDDGSTKRRHSGVDESRAGGIDLRYEDVVIATKGRLKCHGVVGKSLERVAPIR
jgi:hypothetical protein